MISVRAGRRDRLALLAVVLAAGPFTALAVLAGTGWPPLATADRAAVSSLHTDALGNPAFVTAMRAVSDVFGPTTFRVVCALVALGLAVRRLRRSAAFIVATMIVEAAADAGLKAAIGRPRPALARPFAHAAGLAFPSGHALASLVGCGVVLAVVWPALIGVRRALAGFVAAALVVAVGLSRVALGVHFPSDVVGGWLFGLALLAATLALFSQPRPSRARANHAVASRNSASVVPRRGATRRPSARG